MDVNNSNSDHRNISCECETKVNQRPVDFLGDSVCRIPVSSVREIVKKYEPDKEISVTSNYGINNNNNGNGNSGSFPNHNTSHTSMRSVPSLSAKRYNFTKHVTLEEQSPNSSYAVQQLPSSLSHFSKEFQDFKDNNKSIDFAKELADNSYKSKTTIAKTSEGIRITTDIFFDSDSKIPDNWVVKRIETDIPKSKIINDFQKKNNSRR